MRRILGFAAAVMLVAASASASPLHVGLSAYGGVGIPVVNDLSTRGTQFGVRVPISVLSFLSLEPFFLHAGLGDETADVGGVPYTRDGGDLGGWGVNLLLSSPTAVVRVYPYAGVGSYTLRRADAADVKKTGFELGLGVGAGLPIGIGLDVRAGGLAVVTGETSLKYANITAALTYQLPLPGVGR